MWEPGRARASYPRTRALRRRVPITPSPPSSRTSDPTAGLMTGAPLAAGLIATVYGAAALFPAPSVTFIQTFWPVSAVVGVPVIAPVLVLMLRPAGRFDAPQVRVPLAPVAVIVVDG